jgi:sugar (pentulose or hexulose) kinase
MALRDCLHALGPQCDMRQISRIAVDATSATVLLCDASGQPLTPALMYNDRRAREQALRIQAVAPAETGAHGASSSLAKVLWLLEHHDPPADARIQHQADWLGGRLTGDFGGSDYNNALKLGFDVIGLCWPQWLTELALPRAMLPRVSAPGTELGTVQADVAEQLGLGAGTIVCAGTTDSVAAFVASGASEPGDAVTSLGSTLVLKLLSDKPVFSADHGVYSHRLGNRWLAGGASNSGGAVLRNYFNAAQLQSMTPKLNPEQPTGLDYYPLTEPGERFPVNDPELAPRIEPVPDDPVTFFQALLEGISDIEFRGYTLLAQLGAPAVKQVFTAGGGSHNAAWTRLRQARLGVPVKPARSVDAAFGSALLASGTVK